MLRKFLTCDICGSEWDITNTDYSDKISPGTCFRNDKVIEGSRIYHIQTMKAKSDNLIYRDDLDICDKCYNKIDRFIFELKEGGANANL